MYATIFLERTWESLLTLFLLWISLLLVWLFFKPSLAPDMETISSEDAERYRNIYERLNPKIGKTWLAGGMLALAAFGVETLNWPHANWLGATFVPLLRVLAEILIGAAFGQAVDLMLRGAPIIERWIRREKREQGLGRVRVPLLWFLRNPSVVFAVLLVGLVSIVGYQGAPTDMVLNISGALIVTRYLGPVLGKLEQLSSP
jgi:hypothetical protein